LTLHGYDVRVAPDAESGFLEIERRAPGALLVDLHLPIVDGIEFLKTLRQRREHDGMPAAMVTGDYLVDDRVTNELQALGVSLYFKPLWEEDLVAIAHRLFERAAEFSELRGKIRSAGSAA